MCMQILVVGLPLCRASQLYTIWPPAWTGFHVSYSVFITGPPALSGFPYYTHNKASGIDRLPCVTRTIHNFAEWPPNASHTPSLLFKPPSFALLLQDPASLCHHERLVCHHEGLVCHVQPEGALSEGLVCLLQPQEECQARHELGRLQCCGASNAAP